MSTRLWFSLTYHSAGKCLADFRLWPKQSRHCDWPMWNWLRWKISHTAYGSELVVVTLNIVRWHFIYLSISFLLFTQAMSGFLMMLTQNGKLLYISDNAAEYLGHSMVSTLRFAYFSVPMLMFTAILFASSSLLLTMIRCETIDRISHLAQASN